MTLTPASRYDPGLERKEAAMRYVAIAVGRTLATISFTAVMLLALTAPESGETGLLVFPVLLVFGCACKLIEYADQR
jgi:hypothetical protein